MECWKKLDRSDLYRHPSSHNSTISLFRWLSNGGSWQYLIPFFFTLLITAFPAWARDDIPSLSYQVVQTYAHNPENFTQGLYFEDGFLYEGTGLYGRSRLIKGTLEGRIIASRSLSESVFGEGLTVRGEEIIQLTWKSGIGMVWDKESLELLRLFHYPRQGWGLTHNDQSLIMSDGSASLYSLDPKDFSLKRKIAVKAGEKPIENLNELEWIKGKIWANFWKENRIAVIDPATGGVCAWLDLSDLAAEAAPKSKGSVLNGIAYDERKDLVLVTGKRWSSLFALKVEMR